MRIKSETPDLLILEDRPILSALGFAIGLLALFASAAVVASEGDSIGARLLGAAGLGVLVAALVLVPRTLVTLDRRKGVATIQRVGVLRRSCVEKPLASVLGAAIQSRRPYFDRSTRKVHRPALTLADGSVHPLTMLYANGPGAGRVVAAIRQWLEALRAGG